MMTEMHRYRTHTCGELRTSHLNTQVRLSGWLRNRRDHGGVLFIDLADHYGVTQLIVNPGTSAHDLLEGLPKETVIRVDGVVITREAGQVNPNMATGEVEVKVAEGEVLGPTAPLPFSVFPEVPTPEDLRLSYRFLDLRRSKMHSNIFVRSQVIASIRRRMNALGFMEYQTPTLTASSPEGARDYLVPSRRHPGTFYALPQAPQMFKQLIMISGFDRYFQIAPCYRDEDARADRSPGEFYQLDLEMSFVEQEDVFRTLEALMYGLFQEFAPNKEMTAPPFPRITYHDAMLHYGSDKPDLRNPIRIVDVTSSFPASGSFRAFAGKQVRAIRLPKGAERSRSFFDRLEEDAKAAGAKGLAWLLVEDDRSMKGPIAKFIGAAETSAILQITQSEPGDAIVFMADDVSERASKLMGVIRDKLGNLLELIEKD